MTRAFVVNPVFLWANHLQFRTTRHNTTGKTSDDLHSSTMADELDDLFGAIDGAEAEKVSVDDGGTESAEHQPLAEEGKQQLPAEGKDVQRSAGGAHALGTKEAYANMMSVSTSTQPRDENELWKRNGETVKNAEAEAGAGAKPGTNPSPATDKTRDIATGTSHDKTVRSYSAYPKNAPGGLQTPKPAPTQKPAKEYPFQLDPFQAQAVGYIEKEESVLVAAHTSAGKTAVAEYAIAKSLNNGQRVVYTSPIKVSIFQMTWKAGFASSAAPCSPCSRQNCMVLSGTA